MADLIDREKTYEVLTEYYHHRMEIQHKGLREALAKVPTVEPKRCDAIEKIKLIISIPHTVIQEDVLKYKMICDVIARMDEVEEETLEAWNLDGSPTRYIKGKRMDEVEE